MSNRVRLACIAVIALLPFVARWAHQEFRAPDGTREGFTSYLLLAGLCVLVTAVMEVPLHTTSLSRVVVSSTGASLAVLGAERHLAGVLPGQPPPVRDPAHRPPRALVARGVRRPWRP